MAYRGKFKPRNIKKYVGDHTKITYRSGLELKCMNYFDKHKDVISWGSETVIVPYRSPIDNKFHRYFLDFIVQFKQADGTIVTTLIEVKPKSQTSAPKKPSRITRRYLTEVKTWGVNSAKWEAANEYCMKRGWQFVIMTEKQINGLEGS
jgi:nitrate reductase alpha subunit